MAGEKGVPIILHNICGRLQALAAFQLAGCRMYRSARNALPSHHSRAASSANGACSKIVPQSQGLCCSMELGRASIYSKGVGLLVKGMRNRKRNATLFRPSITQMNLYDLRLSRRWLCGMPSSGLWRLVALIKTDVSEEHFALII